MTFVSCSARSKASSTQGELLLTVFLYVNYKCPTLSLLIASTRELKQLVARVFLLTHSLYTNQLLINSPLTNPIFHGLLTWRLPLLSNWPFWTLRITCCFLPLSLSHVLTTPAITGTHLNQLSTLQLNWLHFIFCTYRQLKIKPKWLSGISTQLWIYSKMVTSAFFGTLH